MSSMPISRAQRTTYRVNIREIAEALGISVGANQWVMLEAGDGDGTEHVLTRTVDVVRWEHMLVHPEDARAGE